VAHSERSAFDGPLVQNPCFEPREPGRAIPSMSAHVESWSRIVAVAEAGAGGAPTPSGLCVACVEVLGVAGAGITLMDPSKAAAGYASDPATQRLEELQFGLGEGPTVEAYTAGTPVVEPDLAGIGPARWVGFCPAAVAAGVRSVFSLPLQVGAARVGTLTVYRAESGMLSDELTADMLVVAEMTTRLILSWQAEAPKGLLASELNHDGVYLAVVHQASGMISVQLDVGVGEALAVLRARSFASSRTVAEVAADVVARRVRFDD